MRLIAKLTFLAFVLISVSGACMSISLNPFKKEVVLMSPLKGTLLKAGVPLPNVEIEVVIELMNGKELVHKYVTDAQGLFDIPVQKKVLPVGPMTEFAVNQYVGVIIEGERIEIWYAGKKSSELYGELRSPGEIVGLTCDVDDGDNPLARDEGYVITKCKWNEIRRV